MGAFRKEVATNGSMQMRHERGNMNGTTRVPNGGDTLDGDLASARDWILVESMDLRNGSPRTDGSEALDGVWSEHAKGGALNEHSASQDGRFIAAKSNVQAVQAKTLPNPPALASEDKASAPFEEKSMSSGRPSTTPGKASDTSMKIDPYSPELKLHMTKLYDIEKLSQFNKYLPPLKELAEKGRRGEPL